jgi:uridine kinase
VQPDIATIAARAGASPRPVVLIDGRSGSGKTELGRALAPILSAELVRLDDIYPGWDGLEAASDAVVRDILGHRRWQRWDWAAESFAEWHELDPAAPIVIEGCGSLSRGSSALATFSIWVETDAAIRKARAMARDGEAYAPYWDRWAAQEESFMAREHPADLADLVVVS